ncbi:MAG: hypothetical protein U0746_01305 [Gemmataceae bacterium]
MSVWFRFRPLAIALCVVVLAVPAARADKIDKALMDDSQKLIAYIQAKSKTVANSGKSFNVGVLKFRAQKGDGGESLNVGPINSKMAERVEMTLIMALPFAGRPKPPIQVIHDASGTVAAAKQGLDYMADKDRAKLFSLDYALAVGSDKVKADLFLTGTVRIDNKTHKTAVTIKAFGKDTHGFEKVSSFEIDTDRSTLSDVGMGFALAKRDLKLPDPDGAAVDNAAGLATDNKPPATSPENPVDLKVYINNQEVGTDFDMKNSTSKLRLLQKPSAGDKINFTLMNKLNDRRYAAVLKINGVSTLFDETAEPLRCRKFILNPNASPLKIDGFYDNETGKDNLTPFTVSSIEPNAGEPMKNEELGVISLHVFVEGDSPPIPASDESVQTRGLAPRKWGQQKPKSYADLSSALRGRNTDPRRSFILKGAQKVDGDSLVPETFNNPTQVYFLQIRYLQNETP